MTDPRRYSNHPTTRELLYSLDAITSVLRSVEAVTTMPRLEGVDIASRFDNDRADYVLICSVQMPVRIGEGPERVADLLEWHDALIGQRPSVQSTITGARHVGPRDDRYMRMVLHSTIEGTEVQMWSYVSSAVADALAVPDEDELRYSWQPGHPITPATVRRFLDAAVTA